MVSIFKVKIFSLYTYLKKIQKVIFPFFIGNFFTHEFRVSFIKISTKILNNIIQRDGEGASFNKKPIITVERTKKKIH
jgi:hypothetical protein